MNRRLLVAAALVILAFSAAQACYAQGPVYYGHMPLGGAYPFYPVYQGPYVQYYVGGIYIFEPFAPPGHVFSQPFLGLPLVFPPSVINNSGPPPIYGVLLRPGRF
ncbi:MAG: hypothetical protein Q7T82_16125 [Armatimonadota bacterium]|nr:hypothetical protein [Armatimonadota bacterium]